MTNINIMETNQYYETYRQQSHIFGPKIGSSMSEPVIEGNSDNLRSHLIRIQGSDKEPGKYYYPEGNQWRICTLENLKEQEKELAVDWQNHIESQVNIGERPPTKWPEHLQDKKERLAAKKQVAAEEVKWLEIKLTEAEQDKKVREKKPVQPKFWGAGRLRDNILVEFCGWDVAKNSDGILAIDDPSSPYNTMEIWRLKSEVLNPLDVEHRIRQKQEVKAALAENRPKKPVPYPPVPTYSQVSDQIEYPGCYDPSIIRKLKQSAE